MMPWSASCSSWCIALTYVIDEVAAVSSQCEQFLVAEAVPVNIKGLYDGVYRGGREKSQPSVVKPRHQFLALGRSDRVDQESSDEPSGEEERRKG